MCVWASYITTGGRSRQVGGVEGMGVIELCFFVNPGHLRRRFRTHVVKAKFQRHHRRRWYVLPPASSDACRRRSGWGGGGGDSNRFVAQRHLRHNDGVGWRCVCAADAHDDLPQKKTFTVMYRVYNAQIYITTRSDPPRCVAANQRAHLPVYHYPRVSSRVNLGPADRDSRLQPLCA